MVITLESSADNPRMSKITGIIISRRLAELERTQEWLAEKVGVSINAVSKWTKSGKMARTNVKPVAEALGITVGELLGEAAPEKVAEEVVSVELVYVTPPELHLLTCYREATKMGQDLMMATANGVPKKQKSELPKLSNESQ